VNTLWLPALPLKVAVAVKPGRDDPWTPYRLLQALLAAGLPPRGVSYYPTDHEGATALLRTTGRSLLFGDDETTAPWRGDPRVEVHGPGRSKIVIGEDYLHTPEALDLCVSSILENGGRSCTNASTVVVPPGSGSGFAEALADRLASVFPRDPEDPEAALAAFVRPETAERIDAAVEQGLRAGAAEDVTARLRHSPRLVRAHGGTYLLPTIVRCGDFSHPLANREYLFPYASVVEIPESALAETIGPSLVVTALTRRQPLIRRLLRSPHVGRLHVGAIPTWQVAWDQPHEGNLFDLLYRRRALQVAEAAPPAARP
jgi:acyl-CoA reductase-like NAD-dependent aldehyde dehydrogenase